MGVTVNHPRWYRLSAMPALVVFVFGSAIVAIGLGRYLLAPGVVVEVLWSALSGTDSTQSPTVESVILAVRLPRVLAALLVGASLAAAGATYQTLFRNPLASPAILGVSAGAGLGAALALVLHGTGLTLQVAAFTGGLAAVATTLFISRSLGGGTALVLVLSGMVVSSLCQALTSALKYVADPLDTLPSITFWLLGGLGRITAQDLVWAGPCALLAIAMVLLFRWPIQVLEAGEDEARTLGIPVGSLRVFVIVAATLMTAAAVSIAGVIGWVGLLVPHLARMLVGPAYTRVLPASILLGAGYLTLVDVFCRAAFPVELPLGVVTAVVGAPVFIVILARMRRRWS